MPARDPGAFPSAGARATQGNLSRPGYRAGLRRPLNLTRPGAVPRPWWGSPPRQSLRMNNPLNVLTASIGIPQSSNEKASVPL